jgi:predicted MPP superfamily phosphohydrolase
MAERPLHKIMLFLNMPASWSILEMSLGMLLLAALCGTIWFLLDSNLTLALLVVGMQLLFFLGDVIILLALPRMRISFGPWRAQFFSLAILRTLATVTLGALLLLTGFTWGIIFLLLIQFVGTMALIWGAMIEPAHLQETNLEISSARLQPGTNPIRLLHISDLHIERLSRREDTVLRFIEASQPELIVLTGDYVNLSYNRDPETYQLVREFLSKLSAPYGVFATTGTPTVDVRENVIPIFDDLPVTLLFNQYQLVTLREGRQIVLLGLDCTHHIAADASILEELKKKVPADVPQILLYHSPELMPQAIEQELDLYLCGHTHGGQVRLPIIGPLLTSSHLGRRYVMGLYRDGRTNLYVSRGVGLEGLSAPRVRLLARPEITRITLRPA